jgi:hypothetical protein
MRLSKNIFFLILVVPLLANFASAQNPVPDDAQSAAKQGFEHYKELITEKNYSSLGFESQDEIHKLVLTAPIQEFMVRLDELMAYQSGADPMKLLKGGDEYTFFLATGNTVRSSLTVAKIKGIWQAVSLGSPNKSKLIINTIRQSSSEKLPASSFFLVKIPSLYYYFLGYRDQGSLKLIPLQDDKEQDFKVGVTIPAERTFELLSRVARQNRLQEE